MDDRNTPDENQAVLLWRSLRQFLQVDVEVLDFPESPEPRTPIIVRFTVTNTSPEGSNYPNIVFEDVGLIISTGSSTTRTQSLGTIQRGQSLNYEHKSRYHNLGALKVKAHAKISRQEFFEVEEEVFCPVSFVKPMAEELLLKFDAIPINNLLSEIESSIFTPGPDTNLSELETHIAGLQSLASEIGNTQERLNQLHRDFSGLGSVATFQVKTAYQYLDQLKAACQELEEALVPNQSGLAAGAASNLKALLEQQGQITEATQNFKAHYEI